VFADVHKFRNIENFSLLHHLTANVLMHRMCHKKCVTPLKIFKRHLLWFPVKIHALTMNSIQCLVFILGRTVIGPKGIIAVVTQQPFDMLPLHQMLLPEIASCHNIKRSGSPFCETFKCFVENDKSTYKKVLLYGQFR